MACIMRIQTEGTGAVLVTPSQIRLLRKAEIPLFLIYSRPEFLATL